MPASARRWRQHGSMMRAATFAFVATVAAFAGLACDQQKIIPPGGAGGGAAGVGPGGAAGGAAGVGPGGAAGGAAGVGPGGAAGGTSGTGALGGLVPSCAVDLSGYAGRHCAAYQDGSVWCWGPGHGVEDPTNFVPSATPMRVEGLPVVKQVFVGPGRTCAAGDGAFQCWGDNDKAQIDDSGVSPLAPTSVELDVGVIHVPRTGVGLGASETCIVNAIAHVFCRGTDAAGVVHRPSQIGPLGQSPDTRIPGPLPYVIESGQVYLIADWSHPELLTFFGADNDSISPGSPSCVVKRDGTLWCTDYDLVDPCELTPKAQLGAHALRVGTGDLFLCSLSDDYRVWCEGWNPVGQTGNGTESTFAAGAYVVGLTDVRVLSVGAYSACALTGDGNVWCWGAYAEHQTSNTPVRVSGCANQRVVPALPVRSVGQSFKP